MAMTTTAYAAQPMYGSPVAYANATPVAAIPVQYANGYPYQGNAGYQQQQQQQGTYVQQPANYAPVAGSAPPQGQGEPPRYEGEDIQPPHKSSAYEPDGTAI